MESHYGHPGGGFRTGALTGKTHRCGDCAVSCCCHVSPGTAHITETDNAWLYSLSHQTSDFGESEWIHFTGSGYLLRTDAWSYPVLRLKRLGLSKTFRRLVVTLIRRYGVSLIHLDASAECLPGLPTFDW